jgi:hypothetical protein
MATTDFRNLGTAAGLVAALCGYQVKRSFRAGPGAAYRCTKPRGHAGRHGHHSVCPDCRSEHTSTAECPAS